MQVMKPVDSCPVCQHKFQELRSLYGMHKACPADPGARAVLAAALDEYNEHHRVVHPLHPDRESR